MVSGVLSFHFPSGIGMIFLYFCILLIGCLLYLAEALYYDYGGERTSFDSNETLSITEE